MRCAGLIYRLITVSETGKRNICKKRGIQNDDVRKVAEAKDWQSELRLFLFDDEDPLSAYFSR